MIAKTIFKFIDWTKKSLKWVKDIFDLVKWILLIFSFVVSFGWFKSCKDKKEQIEDLTNILTSEIDTFKTKAGLNAIEVEKWKIKTKSLENINTDLEYKNNTFANALIEAKKTIKDLKIREKDVQSYIKNELVARDSLETSIIFLTDPCGFKLEPVELEFLSLKFKQSDDYKIMGIDYESRNTVYTIFDRKAKPKKRAILKKNIGKDHFILPKAGKLWGWDYYATSAAKDTCSKITNIVSIEFDK